MTGRNLVLTGFMGTGKTSVGRAVARLLQREFVDMDDWITSREGMSVAEIFSRKGEAYFRARERALCEELAARENLVIATGGGALVDPVNRAQFANAMVVCLDASVDEILTRLNGTRERPLLAAARANSQAFDDADAAGQLERGARIKELLATRREAYSEIPAHVDTTGRGVQEVAQEVVNRFNDDGAASPRVSLSVRTPQGAYAIYLGAGLLSQTGELLPRGEFAARAALVTNPTVSQLYAARVVESLCAAGFDPVVIEMPDGERFKTLDTVRGLYDQFVAARLERRSPVLALGGGVLGDTVGFAAATFLRGVPFIQLPTTLLSMIDASIGGKVAVDHPAGKNLIGAFKFPHAVIADTGVLETLPQEEVRAGMAEVIKHAIIGAPGLFEELRQAELSADLIARAMRVKIELVERDPFERNVRAYLNLGHTFGHALEALSAYQLRHGYAVAIGIAVAARLAARIGWCEAATREAIVDLLRAKGLPTRLPPAFSSEQIIKAMGADKKVRDGQLQLILPRAIGRVEIAPRVAREEIIAALEEARN